MVFSAEFSKADKARGEILFNKITKARQDIFGTLKHSKQKSVACYPSEIEEFMYQLTAELFGAVTESGVSGAATYVYEFFYSLLTFEQGFFGTISVFMLMSFFYRMLSSLYGFENSAETSLSGCVHIESLRQDCFALLLLTGVGRPRTAHGDSKISPILNKR